MKISTRTVRRRATAILALALAAPASGTVLTVTDPSGQPPATVMVRERRADGPNLDPSDDGYQAPGVARVVAPEITRFSDAAGRVEFADRSEPMEYRIRKPGYQDLSVWPALEQREAPVTLQPETDPVTNLAQIERSLHMAEMTLPDKPEEMKNEQWVKGKMLEYMSFLNGLLKMPMSPTPASQGPGPIGDNPDDEPTDNDIPF